MPWITVVFGAVISRVFTLFLALATYGLARRLALGTAVILAFAVLYIGVVASVKTAVMAVRISMPAFLSGATYFLPSNLPTIIATIVTVRVSIQLYRWTVTNMSIYASRGDPGWRGPLM